MCVLLLRMDAQQAAWSLVLCYLVCWLNEVVSLPSFCPAAVMELDSPGAVVINSSFLQLQFCCIHSPWFLRHHTAWFSFVLVFLCTFSAFCIFLSLFFFFLLTCPRSLLQLHARDLRVWLIPLAVLIRVLMAPRSAVLGQITNSGYQTSRWISCFSSNLN